MGVPFHARQVSGQLAAVASARTIRASRLSADDRLCLFLRGIQHALGDFDVFNRQIVLVIPAATNFDSWGDSAIGRVLIHWRGEDSRYVSCGRIANGLFDR
jgi:hypothetical protein